MTSAWATDKHCLPELRNRHKEPQRAARVHGEWHLHASLHPFSSRQSPRNFPQRGRRTQGTCFEFSNLILQVIKCLCFGWVLLQFTHSTPSPVPRVNSNIWWLWHTKNFLHFNCEIYSTQEWVSFSWRLLSATVHNFTAKTVPLTGL